MQNLKKMKTEGMGSGIPSKCRENAIWKMRYTWANLALASYERLQAILASLAKVWSHGESCTLAKFEKVVSGRILRYHFRT